MVNEINPHLTTSNTADSKVNPQLASADNVRVSVLPVTIPTNPNQAAMITLQGNQIPLPLSPAQQAILRKLAPIEAVLTQQTQQHTQANARDKNSGHQAQTESHYILSLLSKSQKQSITPLLAGRPLTASLESVASLGHQTTQADMQLELRGNKLKLHLGSTQLQPQLLPPQLGKVLTDAIKQAVSQGQLQVTDSGLSRQAINQGIRLLTESSIDQTAKSVIPASLQDGQKTATPESLADRRPGTTPTNKSKGDITVSPPAPGQHPAKAATPTLPLASAKELILTSDVMLSTAGKPSQTQPRILTQGVDRSVTGNQSQATVKTDTPKTGEGSTDISAKTQLTGSPQQTQLSPAENTAKLAAALSSNTLFLRVQVSADAQLAKLALSFGESTKLSLEQLPPKLRDAIRTQMLQHKLLPESSPQLPSKLSAKIDFIQQELLLPKGGRVALATSTISSLPPAIADTLPELDVELEIKNNAVFLKPRLADLAVKLHPLASVHIAVTEKNTSSSVSDTTSLAAKGSVQSPPTTAKSEYNVRPGHSKSEPPVMPALSTNALSANTQSTASPSTSAQAEPGNNITVRTVTPQQIQNLLSSPEPKQVADVISQHLQAQTTADKLTPGQQQMLLKSAVNQINMDMKTALSQVSQHIADTGNKAVVPMLESLAPLMQELDSTEQSPSEMIKQSVGFQHSLAATEPSVRPLNMVSATDTVLKLLLGLKAKTAENHALPLQVMEQIKGLVAKLPGEKRAQVEKLLNNKSLPPIPADLLRAVSSLRGQSLLSQFQTLDPNQPQSQLHAFLPYVWQGQQGKAEVLIQRHFDQETEIDQDASTGWQFKMRLDAGQKIGSILVNAVFDQGVVNFRFYAANTKAHNEIHSNLPKLKTWLENQKIKVKDAKVSIAEIPDNLLNLPPSLLRIKI